MDLLPRPPEAHIAVMLATRNGAAFLDDQISSLAAADADTVDLHVSDDGSDDGTGDLLEHWGQQWQRGQFSLVTGPRRGFAENFRSLIAATASSSASYFAFCDQDDVWDPDKVSTAIGILRQAGDRPALYCSRTRLVGPDGALIGASPLFTRPAHFNNAIVQSIAGGNTMVMNRAAFVLVAEGARRTRFVSHDWFSYMLVSGAGGLVHYDAEPRVSYRQHGGNVVGVNTTITARLSRLNAALHGRFAEWNQRNIAALEACADLLTDDANKTVASLRRIRAARPLAALSLLRRSGIYRQTRAGSFSLWIATLLGKI